MIASAEAAAKISTCVSVRGVSKRYEAESGAVEALTEVSLDVGEGEFVALVGPSGSGKSTLLHLIAGLDEPSAGELHVAGQDLRSLREPALTDFRREHVGLVFQAFHLVPYLSALDNVLVPLMRRRVRGEDRQRARELLEELGLGERLTHLPAQLSGGEQQRVAIARALICSPDVILADEPTGNLDASSREEVLRVLESLRSRGATLIVATHDADVASRADRVVRLAGGRVVAVDRQGMSQATG